eukprot:scaffold8958_cov110-Isochrysis_galbana.AAC.2
MPGAAVTFDCGAVGSAESGTLRGGAGSALRSPPSLPSLPPKSQPLQKRCGASASPEPEGEPPSRRVHLGRNGDDFLPAAEADSDSLAVGRTEWGEPRFAPYGYFGTRCVGEVWGSRCNQLDAFTCIGQCVAKAHHVKCRGKGVSLKQAAGGPVHRCAVTSNARDMARIYEQ